MHGCADRDSAISLDRPQYWQQPVCILVGGDKCCVQVQHTGVGVAPESATMNGTRWAISPATNATSRERRSSFETSTQHFAAFAGEGGCQLRTTIQYVGAFPCFSLDELRNDGELLGLGKPGERRALRFDSEPRALLLPCGDTVVRRQRDPYKLHTTVCPLYEPLESNDVAVFVVAQRHSSRAKQREKCPCSDHGGWGRDLERVRSMTAEPKKNAPVDSHGALLGHSGRRGAYLIRKASLVSFVPFISSRIQTGVIPRPDHFRPLSFLL
jgi:hypothetical protein